MKVEYSVRRLPMVWGMAGPAHLYPSSSWSPAMRLTALHPCAVTLLAGSYLGPVEANYNARRRRCSLVHFQGMPHSWLGHCCDWFPVVADGIKRRSTCAGLANSKTHGLNHLTQVGSCTFLPTEPSNKSKYVRIAERTVVKKAVSCPFAGL